jgi:hypothetical protein
MKILQTIQNDKLSSCDLKRSHSVVMTTTTLLDEHLL